MKGCVKPISQALGTIRVKKPVIPFPIIWRNPLFPFWPYEWTPLHHHSIKPRPSSCHHTQSHQIPFGELLVCQCHTQTAKFHPWPHSLPVWNCIPTRPPIMSHPRTQPPFTLPITPSPSGTYNLFPVSCTLLLKKATVSGQKAFLHFLTTFCIPDDANQLSR